MYIWTAYAIEVAAVLAEKRYTAREAAEVLGTSHGSVLGRSNRRKEFQFVSGARGKPLSQEEKDRRLEAAKALALTVTPPAEPRKPIVMVDRRCITRRKKVVVKTHKGASQMDTAMVVEEKAFTAAEKRMIFGAEGVNDESVSYLDLKSKSCRWIVSEIDGLNTMSCGKKRIKGSSYCEHHSELARKPKPLAVRLTKALV